jgi:PAS domain S-box-containing protein
MFSFDLHTVSFNYLLIAIISTIVITLLIDQYRNRYKGVRYIEICFVLQTLALILILLRGIIPSLISFETANAISAGGIILFYTGIRIYAGRKSSLLPNLVMFGLFVSVILWFSFVKPDVSIRNMAISVLWLIILLQAVGLLIFRAHPSQFRLTLPVSLICIAFCLVCLLRIIKFMLSSYKPDVAINSDWFDSIMILISQVLLILLTYSLGHMFGNRVLKDIKSEEEKFSKAFNTSPYGMIITRFPDGQIKDINNGFAVITGFTRKDIIGKTTNDISLWFDNSDRSTFFDELANFGKIYSREFYFHKKSGEMITCLISSEVIIINNEQCILSSVDDISVRKQYELELIKAKEKAEESDRLKTAFLHNISHEIRTPLNAIVGFSTLLGEPEVDTRNNEEYKNLLIKASDHLLSIMTDIMEISNIEAGILKFNENKINLNVILDDLYKLYRLRADEKGIELRLTMALPETASDIRTDVTKLIQVLSNLLTNALKFTDKGQVEFGYKLKGSWLEFYVSDTGIGIREELHNRIFDRFFQDDYTGRKKYDGTGLGLSISKAFINLAGGQIRVDSKPGNGATFYFTMPYVRSGQHQETEKELII